MNNGSIRKAWYAGEDETEPVVATMFNDVSGEVLDKNSYCCIAYMEEEEGDINTNLEL